MKHRTRRTAPLVGGNDMGQLVALADANSFFASCETVFDPSLQGQPVVVLSNNDGCVVARSEQAKRLGVINGAPWFKIREQAMNDGVVARSSNYELYASLSSRMMSVMRRYLPGQQIYSIDECFLFSAWNEEQTKAVCMKMRDAVLAGVGIPVSVGVAPTKTLAKIASHWAKRHRDSDGVTLWSEAENIEGDGALASIPVGDVWGVGRRITRKLQAMGVMNALQLRDADPTMIRHRFSIMLERVVLELRGTPCISEDSDANEGARTTQILCSRMFSTPITETHEMEQALSVYAQKACRRLRRQHSLCSQVSAFCSSSPFDAQHEYASFHGTTSLTTPSDDPLVIAKAACRALRERTDPNARYIRAGVLLLGLLDAESFHPLAGFEANEDVHGLGEVLDRATRRFGPARVGIGYGGMRGFARRDDDTGAAWTMRRDMLSRRCTTRWDEMATVLAQ